MLLPRGAEKNSKGVPQKVLPCFDGLFFAVYVGGFMEKLMSLVGLAFLLLISFIFCRDKKHIPWLMVIKGLLLQLVLGVLILNTEFGKALFAQVGGFFAFILEQTTSGAEFLFGPLAKAQTLGFVFAFQVLPTIIFMSALMSVLYHLGIMQLVVKGMAWVMIRLLGTSGAESLSASSNVFVGQTEAPLVVKPYIEKMTRSELMSLMTGGMATIAGSVMAAYVGMGINAGHLLAASVLSAPAALVIAKILVPEKERPETLGEVSLNLPKVHGNVVDAAAGGASEGLHLALNVGAMLIAFVALIALLNQAVTAMGGFFGMPITLESLLGFLFAPVAFLMGVPWQEALAAGSMLGKKLILNEFVAYVDLQAHINNGTLSERTQILMTYALCGFANFSSIAIQIGGIGLLAPSRKRELASLGLLSLLGGTIACLMTACIAGLLI